MRFLGDTPKVYFTTDAISKAKMYTKLFEKQIVWGGVVEEIKPREYLVSDLFLFPQLNGYTEVKFFREDFIKNCPLYMENGRVDDKKMFTFMGKSKANISEVPEDKDFQGLNAFFSDEDFYICMYTNRKGGMNVSFMDIEHNIVWENMDWEYYYAPCFEEEDVKTEIANFTGIIPYTSSTNYSNDSYSYNRDHNGSSYTTKKQPLKLDTPSDLVKNKTSITDLT